MKSLFTLLVFYSSSLCAFLSPERCWEVGGECLYWKPCASTYEYANQSVGDTAKVLGIQSDYDAGFKLWGRTDTHDCCHCWWLSWTHYDGSDRARQGQGTYAVEQLPTEFEGALSASLGHRYDKVDLCGGRYVASHCQSRYYAFGSVGYLNLERKEDLFLLASGQSISNPQRARFEGGFVGVGAGAEIEEPCNLRLLGHLSAVAGIGRRKTTERLLETQVIDRPGQTVCIPGVELRVALEWRYQFSHVWLGVELGYQLDHYFNALRVGEIVLVQGLATRSRLEDLGFGGPLLGLKARF